MEFTQHFAWAVDSSVASDSRAKGNVAVGLDAAAQAFRLLPVAEADRWNLKVLAEMDDGEKARPHVKKCQVVGPAAAGAQCPAFMARLHPHATPHLVSPQVRHTPDCVHPDCVAAMATAEYSGARAMLYSKKGGAPAKRRGRAPRASGTTCPWVGMECACAYRCRRLRQLFLVGFEPINPGSTHNSIPRGRCNI